MKFKPDICIDGLEKLILKGTFNSRRLQANRPSVKLVVDKENIPISWVFFKEGKDSNDEDKTNEMGVMGLVDGVKTDQKIVKLDGLHLSETIEFNLTISCTDNDFSATMNDIWMEKIPYNSSQLDLNSIDIIFSGEFVINWAGYGGEVI